MRIYWKNLSVILAFLFYVGDIDSWMKVTEQLNSFNLNN